MWSYIRPEPDVYGEHEIVCISGGVVPREEFMGPGGDWDVLLTDCVDESNPEQPSELTIVISSGTQVEPVVDMGTSVRLRVVYDPIYDPSEIAFTLRTEPEGALLLAGTNGPFIAGGPYDPLTLELVSVGCNPRPEEDQCGQIVRRAIEVTLAEEVVVISDRNTGSIGQFEVIVGSAQVFEPEPTCSDAPPAYVRALVSWVP